MCRRRPGCAGSAGGQTRLHSRKQGVSTRQRALRDECRCWQLCYAECRPAVELKEGSSSGSSSSGGGGDTSPSLIAITTKAQFEVKRSAPATTTAVRLWAWRRRAWVGAPVHAAAVFEVPDTCA